MKARCIVSLRFLLALACAVLSRPLQAAGILVTNLPVADTAIRDAAPDLNQGTVTSLPVGDSQSGSVHNRGLFKFDLSNLPANSVVTAVTLRLTVIQAGTPDSSFDLNRLLVDWSETDATWNDRLASTLWTIPGGAANSDYVLTASGSGTLPGSGVSTGFSSPGMVSDVQAWINNPATNFGWILIATGDASGSGKQVASREEGADAPSLIVQYTVQSPPAAPILTNVVTVSSNFQFSFLAESNRTYTVEFVGSLPNTNWTVVSNVPSQAVTGPVSIADPLTASNRFYRVRSP
jgi:hypothetical protein